MFSTKVAGILSIVALVLFIGVLVFQLMENSYYGAAPSLW
jgi:hypothetical protein